MMSLITLYKLCNIVYIDFKIMQELEIQICPGKLLFNLVRLGSIGLIVWDGDILVKVGTRLNNVE